MLKQEESREPRQNVLLISLARLAKVDVSLGLMRARKAWTESKTGSPAFSSVGIFKNHVVAFGIMQ